MKKIKEFVLRQVADEYLLIPTGKTTEEFNGMITLSETAAYIWEHFEAAKNLEALVDGIVSEFDIDRETAKADAVEFINDMIAHRLCAVTDPKKGW